MLIGLDFDNTIVCYDNAISQLANEIPRLPKDLPRTKLSVRNFLRETGRESEWTAFQGALYGPGMKYAAPFDGVVEIMRMLRAIGHSICIVSHRSLRPYAGYPYDLHLFAKDWAYQNLVVSGLIEQDQIFFLETLDKKIGMIKELGCQAYVDDLPAVILHEAFPKNTFAILFDPARIRPASDPMPKIYQWKDLVGLIGEIGDAKKRST